MKRKLLALIVFGIAFGFVEAAVVYYLRTLFGDHSNFNPPTHYRIILNLGLIAFLAPGSLVLPAASITHAESLREIATLVMLASIAYLSAPRWISRLAAFMIAFATWDLFYYVFLHVLTGWPRSLIDIDVFFIVPVPWVGPVLTAVLASLVLLIGGILIYRRTYPAAS